MVNSIISLAANAGLHAAAGGEDVVGTEAMRPVEVKTAAVVRMDTVVVVVDGEAARERVDSVWPLPRKAGSWRRVIAGDRAPGMAVQMKRVSSPASSELRWAMAVVMVSDGYIKIRTTKLRDRFLMRRCVRGMRVTSFHYTCHSHVSTPTNTRVQLRWQRTVRIEILYHFECGSLQRRKYFSIRWTIDYPNIRAKPLRQPRHPPRNPVPHHPPRRPLKPPPILQVPRQSHPMQSLPKIPFV